MSPIILYTYMGIDCSNCNTNVTELFPIQNKTINNMRVESLEMDDSFYLDPDCHKYGVKELE